jgi:hypothetical protein
MMSKTAYQKWLATMKKKGRTTTYGMTLNSTRWSGKGVKPVGCKGKGKKK